MKNCIEEKSIVVKSNLLVEATYHLSTQEQRIILIMISMIRPEDKDFQRYRFSINEFKKMAGVTGDGYYKRIKDLTKGLRDKGFVIKEPTGDLQISWISSAKYHDQKGYVELRFDPDLKPYLIDIQNKFTLYQLQNIIKLRSSYSIRIYEILKRHQFKVTAVFQIDSLKELLGIGLDKYKRYNDLKKDVIEKSRKEVSEKTDIGFVYKEIKKGRRVVALHITIKENLQNVTPNKLPDKTKKGGYKIPDEILDMVPELYRESVLALLSENLSKYGKDYVKRNLQYTQSKDYKNYLKYLSSALKNNYGKDQDLLSSELLSKQGAKTFLDNKKQAVESEQYLRDKSLRLKKDADRQALLDNLTSDKFAELTRLAIEKLLPYDKKRFRVEKNKETFPPVIRNRLSMVDDFIKKLNDKNRR